MKDLDYPLFTKFTREEDSDYSVCYSKNLKEGAITVGKTESYIENSIEYSIDYMPRPYLLGPNEIKCSEEEYLELYQKVIDFFCADTKVGEAIFHKYIYSNKYGDTICVTKTTPEQLITISQDQSIEYGIKGYEMVATPKGKVTISTAEIIDEIEYNKLKSSAIKFLEKWLN